jgi:hypothetical protein
MSSKLNRSKNLFWYFKVIIFGTVTMLVGIHLLAVFGIPLAFLLPVLWFFRPKSTPCFVCVTEKYLLPRKHDHCPSCNRVIKTVFNPPLKSLVINVILILLLANISLFGVLLEGDLIFHVNIPLPIIGFHGTAEFLVSQETVNETQPLVNFDLYINSPTTAINAVQTDLRFNNQVLEVQEIKVDQSFANIFPVRNYSNGTGTINLVAGIADPGFIGKGLVARIVFKRKGLGSTDIEFLASSRVLANDGKGTNLLSEPGNTKISIQ